MRLLHTIHTQNSGCKYVRPHLVRRRPCFVRAGDQDGRQLPTPRWLWLRLRLPFVLFLFWLRLRPVGLVYLRVCLFFYLQTESELQAEVRVGGFARGQGRRLKKPKPKPKPSWRAVRVHIARHATRPARRPGAHRIQNPAIYRLQIKTKATSS